MPLAPGYATATKTTPVAATATTCVTCTNPASRIAQTLNLVIPSHTVFIDDNVQVDAYYSGPLPATMTLAAPGFSIDPPGNRPIPANGHVSWVLTPTTIGNHFLIDAEADYTTSSPGGSAPQFASITAETTLAVTDVLGLRDWQIKLLTILGAFLGSAGTATWWIDKLLEYRKAHRTNRPRKRRGSQARLRRA